MAEVKQVLSMGMPLDNWTHKSCSAMIGVGDDWATIYMISSSEKEKGHASELLATMKDHYEAHGKFFGSSIALNDGMRRLLVKFNIMEYLGDGDKW